MPRKKQTFQTINGPVTAYAPISIDFQNTLRVQVDRSWIKRKFLDVSYGPHPEETMDIYLPNEGEGPFPVIIMIHGGGWCDGDKTYWEPNGGIKSVAYGFAVASINYRLGPEHPHPAQIQDVKAAIRFVRANAGQYGFDPNRIATWGGSAGGHLAALAGTAPNIPELTDRSLGNPDTDESVQAVVDWYGPIWIDRFAKDFETLGVITDEAQMPTSRNDRLCGLLQCTPEEIPERAVGFSPASYITKDCPPFLIQHGTADPVVPYLQSVDFDKALSAVIGEEKVTLDLVHGQGHGSLVYESFDNVKRITDWLRKVMK